MPVSSRRSGVSRCGILLFLRLAVEIGDGDGFGRESGLVDLGILEVVMSGCSISLGHLVSWTRYCHKIGKRSEVESCWCTRDLKQRNDSFATCVG